MGMNWRPYGYALEAPWVYSIGGPMDMDWRPYVSTGGSMLALEALWV